MWTFTNFQNAFSLKRLFLFYGIPLVVVVFPFFVELDGAYPFQSIHDHLRSFCDEAAIDCVDLRDHLHDYRGPELWVHPTDQHPNEIAHAIAARVIGEHILHQRARFDLQ